MEENDVQLIHKILSGDEEAFGALVRKHQKSVHALAWRKLGDFHLAEEITQDAFLRVYKSLSTLKNPNQFSGWLYVIVDRLCINWIQRNRYAMQSLEDTPVEEIEEASYTHHVSEQLDLETTEQRHKIVKRLLERLPESERTVVTLHYLGEMKVKDISKFLGVSANTIKSRLSRARKRLQARGEELLISEVLSSVQLPSNLTENIIREASRIKPVPSTNGKPIVPWAIAASVAILATLTLGISNKYLSRFQQPYSLEAVSAIKVDIVEATAKPIIKAKPAVRTQLGKIDTSGKNSRSNPQVDSLRVIGAQTQETKAQIEEAQRIQTEVLDFFRTPEREHQDYTLVKIDATAFEDGGMLTIDIRVGSGKASGSFDLFNGTSELPTEGIPNNRLAHEWGIPPGGTGIIAYRFDQGKVFQLGATGDWFSEKGSINAFHARISIR